MKFFHNLYTKLSAFLSQPVEAFTRAEVSFADSTDKFLNDYSEKVSCKAEVPPPVPAEALFKSSETTMEMNLDTGKIILPENLTPEERKEVEEAIEELRKSLQSLTTDQFASLEQYLASSKTGTSQVVPFISAKGLPDAMSQVSEEMENHKEDTEHYSSDDFLDVILSFHNQGYEFPGFEEMYNKVAQKVELSEDDKKKLEQWYMLVSMELVYDV